MCLHPRCSFAPPRLGRTWIGLRHLWGNAHTHPGVYTVWKCIRDCSPLPSCGKLDQTGAFRGGTGTVADLFHEKPSRSYQNRESEPLPRLPPFSTVAEEGDRCMRVSAVEPLGIIREYCWARSWAQVSAARCRRRLSSAAAVVFCVATRHLTGTRLTPSQQSHPHSPTYPVNTTSSIWQGVVSHTAKIFLYCSPPFSSFISVPPSVHLYSSFPSSFNTDLPTLLTLHHHHALSPCWGSPATVPWASSLPYPLHAFSHVCVSKLYAVVLQTEG